MSMAGQPDLRVRDADYTESDTRNREELHAPEPFVEGASVSRATTSWLGVTVSATCLPARASRPASSASSKHVARRTPCHAVLVAVTAIQSRVHESATWY